VYLRDIPGVAALPRSTSDLILPPAPQAEIVSNYEIGVCPTCVLMGLFEYTMDNQSLKPAAASNAGGH
jgi:hypothetical protein